MHLNYLEALGLTRLEATLPDFLRRQRWFGGTARYLTVKRILDEISMSSANTASVLLLIDVAYRDGGHDTYVVPVTTAFGEDAVRIARDVPRAVLLHLTPDEAGGGGPG